MHLTKSFQREVIHSSGGCESSKNKIIDININWWIWNICRNYCISEFKCDFNSNRLSFKTCNVFRVIIILYTINLYVVLIPQNESKWIKIVSMKTMSNQKILCLPPVANTLRDLNMRFTWVLGTSRHVGNREKWAWIGRLFLANLSSKLSPASIIIKKTFTVNTCMILK